MCEDGYTETSMDRPALKRLLAEVAPWPYGLTPRIVHFSV